MTLFIIFHILVCTFLVFVILLQPGKADAGIGFGSSSQSIFGSRGAGNFLTKTTSICAIIFIFTSFVLTRERILEYDRSVIKNEPAGAAGAPANTAKPGQTEAPKPGDRPSSPGAAAAVPNGTATPTAPKPVNPSTSATPLPKH